MRKKRNNIMRGTLAAVGLGVFLSGMAPGRTVYAQNEDSGEAREEILNHMTLEQKVAQLFFLTPEALTGVEGVTAAGAVTEAAFARYPVGGIIYFEQNIQNREQVTAMLEQMQAISMRRAGFPVFLAVDEEGGAVTRISGSGVEGIPQIPDMLSVGSSGEPGQAYETGRQIGQYLKELGFNLDFAPVADLYSNPENTVIGNRSFGAEADTVSEMVAEAVRGFQDAGILTALKHFPGHGDTAQDSHAGRAASGKTLEELRNNELLPFQAGIEAGSAFVMAGHISLPNILGDDTPASLSDTIITGLLREELGYSGIVITDALNMGAVCEGYTSAQAAVLAIQAGADMLLMPADFEEAYQGVLDAVSQGTITEERIDASLQRILSVKLTF